MVEGYCNIFYIVMKILLFSSFWGGFFKIQANWSNVLTIELNILILNSISTHFSQRGDPGGIYWWKTCLLNLYSSLILTLINIPSDAFLSLHYHPKSMIFIYTSSIFQPPFCFLVKQGHRQHFLRSTYSSSKMRKLIKCTVVSIT